MKNSIIIFFALILTACGTIGGSRFQHVAVSTFYNGQQIDGADCTLTNKNGAWHILSQGATTIQKAYSDLDIVCEKENVPTGSATVKSKTNSLLPNFLTGGAFGSTVDTMSESIFEYPSHIVIYMGTNTFVPVAKQTVE